MTQIHAVRFFTTHKLRHSKAACSKQTASEQTTAFQPAYYESIKRHFDFVVTITKKLPKSHHTNIKRSQTCCCSGFLWMMFGVVTTYFMNKSICSSFTVQCERRQCCGSASCRSASDFHMRIVVHCEIGNDQPPNG